MRIILIFIFLVLCEANSHATDIVGAFGFSFGEKFEYHQRITPEIDDDGWTTYRVSPPEPYELLKQYYVSTSPRGIIYKITGSAEYGVHGCEEDKKIIIAALEQKYGKSEYRIFGGDSIYSRKGSVYVNCMYAEGITADKVLKVEYEDYKLKEEEEKLPYINKASGIDSTGL